MASQGEYSQSEIHKMATELNFDTIEERLAHLGFGQSLNKLIPE